MQGVYGFFALAYYSLACWATALLWHVIATNFEGAVDSPTEFVVVFAQLGLTATMLDAIFTLYNFSMITGTVAEKLEKGLDVEDETPAKYLREMGGAGVYLAALVFATASPHNRVPYINQETHMYPIDAVPFILAATVSILAGVLANVAETNDQKVTRAFPALIPHKTTTGAYF